MNGAFSFPHPTLDFEGGPDGIRVDLPALLEGRALLAASSGGGKSYLLRALLERLAPTLPLLVVDWEGEYPTLRAAHPFVVVGAAGGDETPDVRVDAENAPGVCERLAAAGASVVLDLSEFDDEERRTVAGAWMRALLELPRALRRPILVVVDEAHELAPQSGDVPSSGPLRRLVGRGRKRGIGVIVATQRLSALDKGAAEAANRIFGRTTLDVDVRRTLADLGWPASRGDELRSLSPGSFVVHGPAFGGGPPAFARSPEARTHRRASRDLLPPAGMDQVREVLLAIAEAERETGSATRADLAAKIARLEAELVAAREPDPEAVEREAERISAPLRADLAATSLALERARQRARDILLDAGEIPPDPRGVTPAPEPPESPEPDEFEPTPTPETVTADGEVDALPAPRESVADRIVRVLSEDRERWWSRPDLALAAGTTLSSSTFRQALADLAKAGTIKAGKQGIRSDRPAFDWGSASRRKKRG